MRLTAKTAFALVVAGGLAVAWAFLRGRSEPELFAPGGPAAAQPPSTPPSAEPAPAQPAAPVEPAPASSDAEEAEGYCVRERKKVQIKDPERTTTKNGRPALKGTCPDCGAKIFRFLPQD